MRKAASISGMRVVVHLNDGDMRGERVGCTQTPADDDAHVSVALDPKITLGDSLLVALHAGRGVLGAIEFDLKDKFNSPDRPFLVDSNEVATQVAVR